MATLKITVPFDQQGYMNDKEFYESDPSVTVYRTSASYHLEFTEYDETTRMIETVDGPIHFNEMIEGASDYSVYNRIV